jgi:hypothetical protein
MFLCLVYCWLPFRNLEDKPFDCFHRGGLLAVEKYLIDDPTEIRYLRELRAGEFRCKCNVTASESRELWWL